MKNKNTKHNDDVAELVKGIKKLLPCKRASSKKRVITDVQLIAQEKAAQEAIGKAIEWCENNYPKGPTPHQRHFLLAALNSFELGEQNTLESYKTAAEFRRDVYGSYLVAINMAETVPTEFKLKNARPFGYTEPLSYNDMRRRIGLTVKPT
jgi:hypothetical protein